MMGAGMGSGADDDGVMLECQSARGEERSNIEYNIEYRIRSNMDTMGNNRIYTIYTIYTI